MTDTKASIVLSATFTADPVADVISFWAEQFVHPVTPVIAPYAQVYQQLLDAGSILRTNEQGANVLIVRWRDLAVDLPQAYARAARELSDAVLATQHLVPLLIVLCPEEGEQPEWHEAKEILKAATENTNNVFLLKASECLEHYEVVDIHNREGDQTGKIPYTEEAFTAIGTAVYRWFDERRRKPVKLIAADCDNTLWGGVVGEDGPTGIDLDKGYLVLQENLTRQVENGRVVCLLSKNDEADVQEVFAERQDMVLTEGHIVSRRVNWDAKSDNLQALTAELNLGLDSVLFLDDSTVECAAMRAFCPQVQTVKVPQQAGAFESFVRNLWLFDQSSVTREDKSRVQMYKEQAKREESRRAAVSLNDFFADLELQIDIHAPAEDELSRFSQLTLRTNQFNASLVRLTEPEVRQDMADSHTELRIVSAQDRFGDYGLVGAFRAQQQEDCLRVDGFLLSCRAMGRGIEHQMVAELGKIAEARGLSQVQILYTEGPRNQPALKFLSSIGGSNANVAATSGLMLTTQEALSVSFQPGEMSASTPESSVPESKPSSETTPVRSDAVYQKIATEWTSAATILSALKGDIRERPTLATGYVAPSTQTEHRIADIWQKVLRLEKVGINDPFTDLGGKSIQLVQIHAMLQRSLEKQFEFTLLFEHATIASLARQLSGASKSRQSSSGNVRAQKMRAARNRRVVTRQQRSAAS
ncbi:MAG: HAD-IIIC family phosphatase [Aquisalinus sp.]|nr:HAD-IIIC family phosphatase [Aquisalinus sp.]